MLEEQPAGRKDHHNREHLTGEHALGDLGQIALLVIFIIAWALDSFVLHYSTFCARYISLYVRIPVALLILFYGGYCTKKGHDIVFGEAGEVPHVFRTGVFGIVRHPLYLGTLLFYLSLITLTLSLIAKTLWIVIIVFYYYIARHEEKLLVHRFGSAYEDYLREVPMFIPRITKRRG